MARPVLYAVYVCDWHFFDWITKYLSKKWFLTTFFIRVPFAWCCLSRSPECTMKTGKSGDKSNRKLNFALLLAAVYMTLLVIHLFCFFFVICWLSLGEKINEEINTTNFTHILALSLNCFWWPFSIFTVYTLLLNWLLLHGNFFFWCKICSTMKFGIHLGKFLAAVMEFISVFLIAVLSRAHLFAYMHIDVAVDTIDLYRFT